MDTSSPVPWAERELCGYDTETFGVDTSTDEIVSAVVVHVVPGCEPVVHKWLMDHGTEIPQSASDIHGITTEHARAHGRPPGEALAEIHETLHRLWRPGVPLVGHNPPFDIEITDSAFRRHLGLDLPILGPVVDTLNIDRGCWKYVKGKGMRRLGPTHERYGLGVLENAHDAYADVMAALRVAWAQSKRFPDEVGLLSLEELHERQKKWHRSWALDFGRYLDRQVRILERGVRFRLPRVVALVLGPDVEQTAENIAAAFEGLRTRRSDVLSGADWWPRRPRVESS